MIAQCFSFPVGNIGTIWIEYDEESLAHQSQSVVHEDDGTVTVFLRNMIIVFDPSNKEQRHDTGIYEAISQVV